MSFEIKLKEVQSDLVIEDIQGWLLYDYQRSHSLASKFLEISSDKMVQADFFIGFPSKGNRLKSFLE